MVIHGFQAVDGTAERCALIEMDPKHDTLDPAGLRELAAEALAAADELDALGAVGEGE